MTAVLTIAGYALREALRRKVFLVVLLLTAGFLTLYWLANHYLFRDVNNLGSPSPAIEPRTFAGAFMGFKESGGELGDLTDMNKLKASFAGSSNDGGESSPPPPPPPGMTPPPPPPPPPPPAP